jgi:hypothetical protein
MVFICESVFGTGEDTFGACVPNQDTFLLVSVFSRTFSRESLLVQMKTDLTVFLGDIKQFYTFHRFHEFPGKCFAQIRAAMCFRRKKHELSREANHLPPFPTELINEVMLLLC